MSEHRRFLSKIQQDDNSGCWLWMATTHKGYGKFAVGSKRDGTNRNVLAHRYAYELWVGPIPEGLVLDHLCRTPGCVNPNHLEPVTVAENTRRGDLWLVSASKTHCPQGHPYDEVNTLWRKGARQRRCRTCHCEQNRAYRARLKAAV